jgi:hypothetical protein
VFSSIGRQLLLEAIFKRSERAVVNSRKFEDLPTVAVAVQRLRVLRLFSGKRKVNRVLLPYRRRRSSYTPTYRRYSEQTALHQMCEDASLCVHPRIKNGAVPCEEKLIL